MVFVYSKIDFCHYSKEEKNLLYKIRFTLDHVMFSLVMRRASARVSSASAVSDRSMAEGERVACLATCLNASGRFLSRAAHNVRKAARTPESVLFATSSPHSVSNII